MPERLPHLLFVCVENSCRSQMAEGFARALGAGRVAAFSAGSRPSGRVHASAVSSMKELGIDLETHASKGLDDLPRGITWEFVVTMGCGDACPHFPARHRLDWDLPDPKEMGAEDFRRVRDLIGRRVRLLLQEVDGVDSRPVPRPDHDDRDDGERPRPASRSGRPVPDSAGPVR